MTDDARKPGAIPPGVQAVGAPWSLGVDIQGLSALAGTLYGYAPATQDIVSVIDRRVRKLLTEAGWKGEDATQFGDAWGDDSYTARRLSMLEEDAGKVIDNLATRLAHLQVGLNNWLEDADDQFQKIDETQVSLRKEINDAKKEALKNAKEESERFQKSAAGELIKLYKPEQGWSLLGVLNKYDSDRNLPDDFRDKLEDVKDDLDDAVPEGFWNQKAASEWAATGGATVGGVGGVTGAIIGGTAGTFLGVAGAGPAAVAGAGTLAGIGTALGAAGGFLLGGLFG